MATIDIKNAYDDAIAEMSVYVDKLELEGKIDG